MKDDLERYAERRMDQLDKRYMKGEYTREEYEQKVKDIEKDFLLFKKRLSWISIEV